ncbi:flagellar biosynthetic protein FliO [soil metagenome]
MSQTILVFIALLIVLALIGLATWLVRRFGGSSLGAGSNRGRMPRLAVIDAAAVDGRRRLVLVRRDNVEHLLMIGGPTDVVVEPNIVRSMPQRDQVQRAPAGTELPPRLAPDAGWSDADAPHIEPFEHREPPAPELPSRPARGPYADDARRAPPPLPDRQGADSMPSFAPEPMVRPQAPARAEPPRTIPRSERSEPIPPRMPRANDLGPKPPPLMAPPGMPPLRPPARPAEPSLSSADQNLADMAQRLEAALRRPGGEPRPDAGESRAAPTIGAVERPGAPPVVPEAPSRPVPRAVTPPAPLPPPTPDATTAFENLEDEMANLLGRPKPPA